MIKSDVPLGELSLHRPLSSASLRYEMISNLIVALLGLSGRLFGFPLWRG